MQVQEDSRISELLRHFWNCVTKILAFRSSTDIEVATKPSVVEAPPSVQILAHHREHAKRVVSFEIIDRIEN